MNENASRPLFEIITGTYSKRVFRSFARGSDAGFSPFHFLGLDHILVLEKSFGDPLTIIAEWWNAMQSMEYGFDDCVKDVIEQQMHLLIKEDRISMVEFILTHIVGTKKVNMCCKFAKFMSTDMADLIVSHRNHLIRESTFPGFYVNLLETFRLEKYGTMFLNCKGIRFDIQTYGSYYGPLLLCLKEMPSDEYVTRVIELIRSEALRVLQDGYSRAELSHLQQCQISRLWHEYSEGR